MYEYVSDYTCTLKFNVMVNRDGNILQEGETPAGQKHFMKMNAKINHCIMEF